jgi:regulator of sirC expression with transglutaminase-like and TPR domain
VPRSHHFSDDPEFLRLLRGEVEPDLTRLCLELARDAYPGLHTASYLTRIDALAERIRDRCPQGARVRHILGQINWVLFVEEGFRGDVENYQDSRNSYLNELLDRRLGIPISLSALYLVIAERLGLAMSGVNLPGHFVIRVGLGESVIFVDPFHEGAFLDRSGCERLATAALGRRTSLSDSALAPCSTRDLVSRMLRNLKAIYLRELDFHAAVPILRRLVALTRGDLHERRDLGIALLRTGDPGESLAHLSDYLAGMPNASDREDIAALVRVAGREIAGRN